MPYLVDTNVLSELRKNRRCDANVSAWQSSVLQEQVFISSISLMEITRGISMARRRDPAFSEILEDWYESQLKPTFEHRVIAVDKAIAEYCGNLMSHRTHGLADALLAATAYVHILLLVTRNMPSFSNWKYRTGCAGDVPIPRGVRAACRQSKRGRLPSLWEKRRIPKRWIVWVVTTSLRRNAGNSLFQSVLG